MQPAKLSITAAKPQTDSANPPIAVITVTSAADETVRYEFGVWPSTTGTLRYGRPRRFQIVGGRTFEDQISALPKGIAPTAAAIAAALDAIGL